MTDWAQALLDGDSEVALGCFRDGDVNRPSDGSRGRSPIAFAARLGNDAVLRLLVERGARLEEGVGDRGLLQDAAQGGVLWFVKHLVNSGADVDEVDKDDCTALCEAVFFGRYEVAAFLLEREAAVGVVASGPWAGFGPLEFAILRGAPRCVKLLVDAGATFAPLPMFAGKVFSETCAVPEEDLEAFARERLRFEIPKAIATSAFVAIARALHGLPSAALDMAATAFLQRVGVVPGAAEAKAKAVRDEDLAEAIAEAVDHGDLAALLPLLKRGGRRVADLFEGEDCDDYPVEQAIALGWTPLHLAVSSGDLPSRVRSSRRSSIRTAGSRSRGRSRMFAR